MDFLETATEHTIDLRDGSSISCLKSFDAAGLCSVLSSLCRCLAAVDLNVPWGNMNSIWKVILVLVLLLAGGGPLAAKWGYEPEVKLLPPKPGVH